MGYPLVFWLTLASHVVQAQQVKFSTSNPAIIELGQLEGNKIKVTARVQPLANHRAYDLRLQYKVPATGQWKNTSILFIQVSKKNRLGMVQPWTIPVQPKAIPWDKKGDIEARLVPVGSYRLKKVYLPVVASLATGGLLGLGYFFRKKSEATFKLYETATNAEEARNLDKANQQFRTGTLLYYGAGLAGIVSLVWWWKARVQHGGLRKMKKYAPLQRNTKISLGNVGNSTWITLTLKF